MANDMLPKQSFTPEFIMGCTCVISLSPVGSQRGVQPSPVRRWKNLIDLHNFILIIRIYVSDFQFGFEFKTFR